MKNSPLIERIQALDKLTPSEVKLAEFFSGRATQLLFENVTTLAEKTAVSKATVVRFIAKLGYANFSELRAVLQAEARVMFEPAARRYSLKKRELETSEEDIIQRNLGSIVSNLQHVIDTLDRGAFQQTAEAVYDRTGDLYLWGFRTSFALAQMFHFMIRRIRPRAILIDPGFHMMPDMLMDVTGRDLLLAVFRYPYARQTVGIARRFADAGAPVYLVTDSAFSPLADLATRQIVVGSEGLDLFRSFTAMAAILETLHMAVLRLCDEDLDVRIEAAETLFREFDVYCPKGKGKIPRKP
ncbi:MAG: MurR/RpiR family transcriptional regulator [Desulfobacterales bacterium]